MNIRHLTPKHRRLLFIVLIIGLLIFTYFRVTDPGEYIRDINRGYSGVIVDKFVRRVTQLTIRTTSEETFTVSILSDQLIRESAIGDSIEKPAGDNYVILSKKDGVKKKVPYLYISTSIRNDFRWPKEWKDKWVEDN